MILYHGSNQLITKIDLSKSKDFKDFGRGFYLTKDYMRAVAMAQRTTAIIGEGSPDRSCCGFTCGCHIIGVSKELWRRIRQKFKPHKVGKTAEISRSGIHPILLLYRKRN